MKLKLFILALFSIVISIFAFDFSKTDKLEIPEGNVLRVNVGESQLWPTKIPYITNGLINMWDARWNTGIGQHDNNTDIWKDLVGDRDMVLAGTYHWTNNAWIVESVTGEGRGWIPAESLPPSQTIQVVIHPTNIYIPESRTNTWNTARIFQGIAPAPSMYIYRTSNSNGFYFISWNGYEESATRAFSVIGGSNAFTSLDLHQHTLSHEEDSPIVQYHIDSETKHTYVNTNSDAIYNGTNSATMYFANNGSHSAGLDASYYCIRFYDKVLSNDEMAWNYMIDSIRYGLPRKLYPYMNSSWSWIDFQDKNMLLKTVSGDLSEIGDPVLRIRNKGGLNHITWIGSSTIERTDGGVRGSYIDGGHATNVVLRANSYMFTTNDDWKNIEFATILITSNELASTFNIGNTYLIYPNAWQAIMLFFNGAGTLYYRSLQTNNSSIKIEGLTQEQIKNVDPMILSVRVKSVNGEANTRISINGTEILNANHTMPEYFPRKDFQPAIVYSYTLPIMARDYCENLWWNHIPEDWDKIEQTLMLKYDAKPLTYYIPDYSKPLLSSSFGGIFTGGDIDEPEELEELPDEEIEESE